MSELVPGIDLPGFPVSELRERTIAACAGLRETQPRVLVYACEGDARIGALGDESAAVIARRIRAFDPFPGASTSLHGELVKLWRCEINSAVRPREAGCGQWTG